MGSAAIVRSSVGPKTSQNLVGAHGSVAPSSTTTQPAVLAFEQETERTGATQLQLGPALHDDGEVAHAPQLDRHAASDVGSTQQAEQVDAVQPLDQINVGRLDRGCQRPDDGDPTADRRQRPDHPPRSARVRPFAVTRRAGHHETGPVSGARHVEHQHVAVEVEGLQPHLCGPSDP